MPNWVRTVLTGLAKSFCSMWTLGLHRGDSDMDMSRSPHAPFTSRILSSAEQSRSGVSKHVLSSSMGGAAHVSSLGLLASFDALRHCLSQLLRTLRDPALRVWDAPDGVRVKDYLCPSAPEGSSDPPRHIGSSQGKRVALETRRYVKSNRLGKRLAAGFGIRGAGVHSGAALWPARENRRDSLSGSNHRDRDALPAVPDSADNPSLPYGVFH